MLDDLVDLLHQQAARHLAHHALALGVGADRRIQLQQAQVLLLGQNRQRLVGELRRDDDLKEDLAHLLGDSFGVLRRKLRAVRPIYLVAVILLGVMRCGYVKAGSGTVAAHGKAQLRSRAQSVKNANMYAVCGHNACSLMSKKLAVVAAVKADGYALFHCFLALSLDDICKRLGGVADDVDIHLMQTELHCSAQSGSAELERRKKAALDLFFVVCY